MNLYDKIRSAECEIPDAFDLGASQMLDFVHHSRGECDLACIAFKFGYIQGQRAAECKTNKANEKQTEGLNECKD